MDTDVQVRRRGPLVAVLTAHGISLTGNAMTALAVPWFVLQTTGSARDTGIVAAASFLPIVLSMTFGGVLIDRVGYRRASVLCDLAGAAMIVLIPALHLAGLLSLPLLVVLVFLGTAFDTPGYTARQALLPALTTVAGTTTERATSALGVVDRAARMVGAPIAGALIAFTGPVDVLFVDAGTFLVAAVVVALSGAPNTEGEPVRGSYWTELRTGFGLVWRDRLLRIIALLIALTNVLDVAYASVLLPVYGAEVLRSATSIGLLIGTAAVASVIGGIVFGAVAHRLPRRALFVVVFTLVGVPRCLVLAMTPGLAWVLVTVAATGFCSGMINPILGAVQYQRIPEKARARALGALGAFAYSVVPLGPVIGGALVATGGIANTLLIFMAVYAAAVVFVLPLPAWRGLDDTAETPRKQVST